MSETDAVPMAQPIIEARGLTKRFQGLVSVDKVSFSIAENEILGLIGPNGAGKTTLVNMISGTLKPNAGDLLFEGRRINELPPYRRAHLGIARTFQVMKPFHGMSVLENVTIGALFGRGGGEKAMRRGARERARMDHLHRAFPADGRPCRCARRPRPQAARIRQGARHAARSSCCSTR